MSSREEFAGVAPSGRIVMSGATTGLEMLDQALANWPVLESTRGGGLLPAFTQSFATCTGPRPAATPNTIDDSARASKSLIHTPNLRSNGFIHTQSGSILMRISLATRGTTTDSLPLLSVRIESIMGRQFVDIEAEHLQERTVVGRRAEHLQQREQRPQLRVMGRPIIAVERPENTSYHSNQPVRFLLRTRRRR